MKDIVVVLPGITGSRLQKAGKDVWSMSAGGVGRALATFGGNIRQLAMRGDDPDQEYLDDGVREAGLLPDVHLLPGLWRIDGYSKVCDTLLRQFELVEGANFIRFAYDWRRDNRAHAKRLARESREWLRAWRESSGAADAKLILVCHSMGGLLARYFLECCMGWRDTRMLITFGTPYSGSLNAVDSLVNGWRKSFGPVTLLDLIDTLRTFPAAYQLLPVYQCIDRGDGTLRRLGEIGPLPGMDAGLLANALRFHQEIEEAVARHRAGLSSVPRELFESQRNVMYAAFRHSSLQNADPVLTHVHGLLRGTPADPGQFFAGLARLGLGVGDLHEEQTPIGFQVRCDVAGAAVRGTVLDLRTGMVAARVGIDEVGEDWTFAEIPPLAAGDYRLTIASADAAPVSDIFTVVGPGSVTPWE